MTEAELAEVRARNAELEKRQSKGERQLQNIDKEYRDQLTERNTLLLTIYQYIGKIQGLDTTPVRRVSDNAFEDGKADMIAAVPSEEGCNLDNSPTYQLPRLP